MKFTKSNRSISKSFLHIIKKKPANALASIFMVFSAPHPCPSPLRWRGNEVIFFSAKKGALHYLITDIPLF
jgi:hypothetical protein